MRRNTAAGVVAALSFICTLAAVFYSRSASSSSSLSFFISEPPTSLDPLEYNLLKNFALQSLVNIKFFSNYRDAALSGQLIESWSSRRSNTIWRFRLRKDVKFSDGKPVTVADAVSSLRRVLYVIKSRSSHNDLLDAVADAENLVSASAPRFTGVRAEGNELVIELKKPYPKMLEVLGFGLYSVVKPVYFDSQTGVWTAKYNTSYVGAGPYIVESIEASKHVLRRRFDYPVDLIHAKAFDSIEMVFDLAQGKSADLRSGTEDLLDKSPKWTFHSAGSPYIMYMICHSWKRGPCRDKSFRVSLRAAVEVAVRKNGVNATRSFFPLTISGVTEPAEPKSPSSFKLGRQFTYYDYRPESKSQLGRTVLDAFEEAIVERKEPATGVRLPWDDMRKNLDPDLKKHTIDIALYTTDITPYDPEGDIRFMFSNEGVRLPDATGEIRKELAKDTFSIQKVNELLYEQAIVWPITHITYGIWANPRLDFSRYGFLLPLAELQWIGQK